MELSFAFYIPVIVVALAYVVLYMASAVVRNRGDEARAEGLLDAGFGLALLAGAYVVILLLVALVDMPNEVGDLLAIVGVVAVFFAVLLFAFFGLFELLFSRGGRRG